MARRMSASAIETVLTELGAEVSTVAKAELLRGGQTILTDANARIHSISGKLSASGKLKVNAKGTVVKIVFDAENKGYGYSKIVEFRPGHEHPFLYPAYDAHRNQVKQNVIDAIRQAVRSRGVS